MHINCTAAAFPRARGAVLVASVAGRQVIATVCIASLLACGDDAPDARDRPDSGAPAADSNGDLPTTDTGASNGSSTDAPLDAVDGASGGCFDRLTAAVVWRPSGEAGPTSMSFHDGACQEPGCTPIDVGAGVGCGIDCRPTGDLSHVMWLAGDTDVPSLHAAAVGPGGALTDTRVIAANVGAWGPVHAGAVYSVDGQVWRDVLDGSTPTREADTISGDGRFLPGGFFAPSSGDVLFVNRPTSLSAMDLVEITMPSGNGETRTLFHFVSGSDDATGSYYQGQLPMALSPDGALFAVVTNALDVRGPCDETSECPTEYECQPDFGRCMALQRVLHVIERSRAPDLQPGSALRCGGDGDCGDVHVCERAGAEPGDDGVCVPFRHIIGPWGGGACGADAEGGPRVDAGEYGSIVGTPGWTADGQFAFAGALGCSIESPGSTDFVLVDPRTGALTVVASSTSTGPACAQLDRDSVITPSSCALTVRDVSVSPDGRAAVVVTEGEPDEADAAVFLLGFGDCASLKRMNLAAERVPVRAVLVANELRR